METVCPIMAVEKGIGTVVWEGRRTRIPGFKNLGKSGVSWSTLAYLALDAIRAGFLRGSGLNRDKALLRVTNPFRPSHYSVYIKYAQAALITAFPGLYGLFSNSEVL